MTTEMNSEKPFDMEKFNDKMSLLEKSNFIMRANIIVAIILCLLVISIMLIFEYSSKQFGYNEIESSNKPLFYIMGGSAVILSLIYLIGDISIRILISRFDKK